MRLKRWESPRRTGRNDKGRGGSARQRQLKKQQQMLRKKLKDDSRESQIDKLTRGEKDFSPFAFKSRFGIRDVAVNVSPLI